MSPGPTLEEAVGLHQSGRLDEAEALYQSLLANTPHDPDALHLLGVLNLQRGDLEDARALISQALEISPDHPFYLGNLGIVLLESGAVDNAVDALKKALTSDPEHLDARYNLGNALMAQGNPTAAAEEFARVAGSEPAHLPAANNHALCLAETGRLAEAATILEGIVRRAPQDLQTRINLGKILQQLHRGDEAIVHYETALAEMPDDLLLRNGRTAALIEANRFDDAAAAIDAILIAAPDDEDVLLNLANLQSKTGNLAQAVETFQKITELNPDHAGAWNNLGSLLWRNYRYDEALNAIRRALALRPDHPDTLDNHGLALAASGDPEHARMVFDQALETTPDHGELTFDRGLLALSLGQYSAGASDYRARPGIQSRTHRLFRDPLPGDLSGQRVVVEADQGLGDELFFLRFMPQLRERGARTHYAGDRRLLDMLRRASVADSMTALSDHQPSGLESKTIAVGDLPYVLGLSDNDTPPPSLCLPALADHVDALRNRLANLGPPPYIGVTWRAGTAGRREAIFKQVPLADFAHTLRDVTGTFIALQRLPVTGEIEQFSGKSGAPLHDLTALNEDLEAMLALTGLLDEYICVSNTNVHLRATQGLTCRVLVPHPPEFRWMYDGNQSAWFPGSRIYRQARDGDWSPALQTLRSDLLSG